MKAGLVIDHVAFDRLAIAATDERCALDRHAFTEWYFFDACRKRAKGRDILDEPGSRIDPARIHREVSVHSHNADIFFEEFETRFVDASRAGYWKDGETKKMQTRIFESSIEVRQQATEDRRVPLNRAAAWYRRIKEIARVIDHVISRPLENVMTKVTARSRSRDRHDQRAKGFIDFLRHAAFRFSNFAN